MRATDGSAEAGFIDTMAWTILFYTNVYSLATLPAMSDMGKLVFEAASAAMARRLPIKSTRETGKAKQGSVRLPGENDA
jgi:hypothetical protein